MRLSARSSLLVFALLIATCVAIGAQSNAPADNSNSVEWLCAAEPARVRALFDSLNLEKPGMETVRRAVVDKDYSAACNALVAYYRNASTAKWLRKSPVDETEKRDAKCEPMLAGEFTYYGKKGKVPRATTGRLDWGYGGPANADDWRDSHNMMGYVNQLMSGYLKTGRREYVEQIDRDIRDWILSNPHPGRMMRRGPWNGLQVSARVTNWMLVFYGLQGVDAFTPATRILMLSSLAEHAQYLMLFHRRDFNNWTVQEVTSLGIIGCAWPEFRDAPGWRAYSQEKVGDQMRALAYPDGAEAELSCGYHKRTTEEFEEYAGTIRQFGYPVADSLTINLKRMWSYLAYTMRPDGTTPENNDTDRRNIAEQMVGLAKKYNQPDWEYIATQGRDGSKPRIGPTITFPWAGQTIMRSGWDADAQWTFFDAGPFGVAHQHYDKLHVSIDAFGRALLVDAGRFQYQENAYRDYFVSSAAHNVLLIDGAGQNKTPERAERPLPGTDYGSTSEFDYARGVFDAGYPGTKGRAVHTRAIVYVRNQFWIVADRVETDRKRKVEALWHFAPDCSVVIEGRNAVSTDEGKGNLRIVPVGGTSWRAQIVKGADSPVQGWYSGYYTEKEPNPTAIYSAEIPGTTTLVWVLTAARGAVPAIDASVISSREDRVEVRVRRGDEKAYVVTVPMNSWRPSVRRDG